MPEIAQGLGELPTHYRTTADSFENAAIKDAVEKTGRRTVLLSGVATELAVQLPGLAGIDLGYRMFVVVDAVGGLTERTEAAALSRLAMAGTAPVSIATLAGELAGDFTRPGAQQAIQILFQMAGGA
jgi:nicotinamidase-related amidase